MDKFLVPDGGKPSAAAPPRTDTGRKSAAAKALRRNSSLIRKMGRLPAETTATPSPSAASTQVGKQPATKKSRPSYLEQLRGKKLGSKKPAGLCAALRESLVAGSLARKRQLSNSIGEEQRQRQRRDIADENTAPDATPAHTGPAGRPAGSGLRSKTEKIRSKRPLAAAAAAAAREAGWFDMPGGARDPRGSGQASKPPGSVHQQQQQQQQQQQKASLPPSLQAVEEAGEHATAAAAAAAAATTNTTSPRATGGGSQPARKRDEATRRHKPPPTVAVPSRAGRMDEFFPRRVVTASPGPLSFVPVQQRSPPLSSSVSPSHRAGASEPALPREAQRGARHRSRDCRNDDGGGRYHERGVEDDDGASSSEGPWEDDKHLDPFRSDDELEGAEDVPVPEFDDGVSTEPKNLREDPPAPHNETLSTASCSAEAAPPAQSIVVPAGDTVARSTARREAAARAAAAAERRAAAAAAGEGVPEGGATPGAEALVMVDVDGGIKSADQGAAAAAATGGGERAMPAVEETSALARAAALPEAPTALAEEDGVEAAAAAAAAATATSVAAPWPCRRRRGAASLFLSQRQRTGGLRSRGVGVGDAGRDTFRRQAISTVLGGGLRVQRLRMGCTSNSRTSDGVVRGHPEAQGVHGRVAGGVTCLEFDAVGWQLAVGGENVTVYDFDRYIPENNRLKHTLVSGVRAYLQPTDGIQTRRTVSCVRWNPANGEQLAVCYLNYDEVEVYDLRRIHPDRPATPVLTLLPSAASAAVAAAHPPARSGGGGAGPSGGAFGRGRAGAGNGAGGSSVGAGFAPPSSSSSSSGKFRGLGHLTLEFVRRGPPGGEAVTHLVAGARGGVFRVWRFFPERAKQLSPYLQGQVTASHRGGGASYAGVTAVCCLTPDIVLVGTESGQLATYSLTLPVVKNFRSSKNADQRKAWSLAASSAWGGETSPAFGAANAPAGHLCVQFLRLSPEHGPGVVLCGLRNGRVVIFDTGVGRALGITEPHRGSSVGFCPPPAAALIPTAPAAATTVAISGNGGEGELEPGSGSADPAAPLSAPLTEGEGAKHPYGGGHWGPVVLACCKPSSEGGVGGGGGEELVVLSTSARAALDSDQRRGDRGTTRSSRKAGLRPGRGWEIGEAGGGGFRLEESEGYDMCLPVEVLEATPGRSRVRVSADVRGYLCPGGEDRLLRTRLVTSSVMIGRERHSVEDVSADGTVLVLDRKYQGPAVAPVEDEPSPPWLHEGRREGGGRGGGGGGSTRAGSIFRSPSLLSGDSQSGASGGQDGSEVDGSEVDEPEPAGVNDAAQETRSLVRAWSATESAARSSGVAAVENPVVPRDHQAETDANGGEDASSSGTSAVVVGAAATPPREEQPPQRPDGAKAWDRAWRPSRVRLFAKLRAVFGDEQQQQRQEQKSREEASIFGGSRRLGSESAAASAVPSYPLYQVVARAKLDLPVTAVTSHPRMNFVLVGLSDGTVAAVLPRGKRGQRTAVDTQ